MHFLPSLLKVKKRGDTIAGTVGDDARGVAIGKNIVQIGTLVIPPLTLLPLVTSLVVAIVVVLVFVVPSAPRPAEPPATGLPPGVAAIVATPGATKPPQMRGNLKVAVATFGALDDAGRLVDSPTARDLAATVYRSLDAELAPLRAADRLDIPVNSPDSTGTAGATTLEELPSALKSLGETIGADVLVYGNLKLSDSSFVPKFYLSETHLLDAEELSGLYELGPPLLSRDIRRDLSALQDLANRLSARTRALARFLIGLSMYGAGRWSEANQHFSDAAGVPTGGLDADCARAADDDSANEVYYLFLANTAGKMGDLDRAEQYFQLAQCTKPDYVRAWVGLAEVKLLKVVNSGCLGGTAGCDDLREAVTLYERAKNATNEAGQPTVRARVSLGLGRGYYFLQQGAAAESALRDVIRLFGVEAGNERLRDMAAQAYGFLGLVYRYLPGDDAPEATRASRAAKEYAAAVELLRPPPNQPANSARLEQQAAHQLWLAYSYLGTGDCAAAATALAEAEATHRRAVSADRSQPTAKYDDWRKHVEAAQQQACITDP